MREIKDDLVQGLAGAFLVAVGFIVILIILLVKGIL